MNKYPLYRDSTVLLPADEIRLGETIITDYGVHVGPLMRIELDWKNGWATFTDTDRQEHQCLLSSLLQVVRKSK